MATHDLARATHMGELEILNHHIPCAVLDDGTRILSDRGLRRALGYAGKITNRNSDQTGSLEMPVFLAANNLKPFVFKGFAAPSISYQPAGGGPVVQGYEASVLPKVCGIYLAARRAGRLHKSQQHIAEVCEILLGALAETGIVALVDEATGFQADRDRDALQKIFNHYLRKNFAAWSLTFYPGFYRQLFKLCGWKWDPANPARGPRCVAAMTKDLVYERLAGKGLLEELERRNPLLEDGDGNRRRAAKHHQWFEPAGREELVEHVNFVTRLMRVYPDFAQFYRALERACPKRDTRGVQLDFGDLDGIDLFNEAA